ncbi:MAG: hypothetical protein ACYC7L_17230 [Nitrospirota bacterium]
MKRTHIFVTAMLTLAALTMPSCSKKDRTTEGRPGVIMPADVSFPGMQMRPGENASTFTLIGRVKNKAAHGTITEVTLRMTMEDVLASGPATTMGETRIAIKKEVPPSESRDFEEKVSFGTLPKAKGRHEWNYSVVEVKGK